ncbi:MAG: rRNA ((1939)-C(5))-methyltransferase [Bacteroidota bacterium]|jgi:23S rRNA (uracil1939-C5)-methyltransferase
MSRRLKPRPIIPQVEILDFAAEAKCIAKIENEIIFVEGKVAPGDIVDLQILKSKKSFKQAKAINIQEKSKYRIEPKCKHFGVCGGCKWQHVSYNTQLSFKQKQVQDNLQRIGKVKLPEFNPILGSKNEYFYRNKLEFTFSDKKWLTDQEMEISSEETMNALGFHVPGRFDKILDINECFLQSDFSNKLRNAVREFAIKEGISFYEIKNQTEGALRNLIIRNNSKGEYMVILQFAYATEEEIEKMMSFIHENFPDIYALLYTINQKGNDTLHDLEVKNYAGNSFLIEEMEDLSFQLGPKSFFQTNSHQALRMYQLVRDYANIQPNEIVYDLYTGTGTIALFVAKNAQKVIGLEYVEMAVEDAKINAKINNIENTEFFAGDMKKVLTQEFIKVHGKPNVIITDPPRAGMDPEVIQQILLVEPNRIVYVSCNPATQARDLNLLDEKYEVVLVQPIDMFPQTHHVENIVLLNRKK